MVDTEFDPWVYLTKKARKPKFIFPNKAFEYLHSLVFYLFQFLSQRAIIPHMYQIINLFYDTIQSLNKKIFFNLNKNFTTCLGRFHVSGFLLLLKNSKSYHFFVVKVKEWDEKVFSKTKKKTILVTSILRKPANRSVSLQEISGEQRTCIWSSRDSVLFTRILAMKDNFTYGVAINGSGQASRFLCDDAALFSISQAVVLRTS